jgi:predicted O-linked N-acetylglucosamine transferase (SPINDLY family)
VTQREPQPAPVSTNRDDACVEAMNHQIAGRLDLAEQLYREILRTEPKHAAANHCIGMLHLQLRQPLVGLPYLLAALDANPQNPDYWLGYLEALLASGQTEEAKNSLTLGRQHGLEGSGVEAFAQRLAARLQQPAAKPNSASPAGPPGAVRAERRRNSRAAHRKEGALLALLKYGDLAAARRAAQQLTERAPERGMGWKVLGSLLWADGHQVDGLAAMQVSTQLLPGDAEAHTNLGAALTQLERFEEAETSLKHAVKVDPGFTAAYTHLGNIYQLQGRHEDAVAALRIAMSRSSDDIAPHQELPHTTFLFALSHNPAVGADEMFTEHRKVGAHMEDRLRSSWPRHRNLADPTRPLRIGLVSGDFYEHPVGFFIEPILVRLQENKNLELHGYDNNHVADAVNQRFRGYMDHWHPVEALSDIQLAKQIMHDRIDILIDLSGHTARNRLRAFARKPAPIQASWLGYPGTTGLSAIDYYLADRHWLPPGQFDRLFSEKLVYLPDRWAFRPHPDVPPIGPLPALETGCLTFGSFHRLGKINSSTIRLWSQLLLGLPQATLLMVGIPLDGKEITLLDQFAAHGIERPRVTFHSRCTMDLYLALHNRVDIGLDTHPYTGATTTMHSLSMGVPTLTMAGATSMARAGAGILAHVGLDGFIATDADDFVAKGIYWAHHLADLAAVRAGLRARLEQSPGGQPALIAAHLDGALRHMWQRWCAGLPAESFHSIDIAAPAPSFEAASVPRRNDSRGPLQQERELFSLVNQRRFAEAIIMARTMTERFPDNAAAWKTLGALSWAEGNKEAALAAMRQSVALQPHDVEAHRNLALTLSRMMLFEEAEACLRTALRALPDSAQIHGHLGDLFHLQNRLVEAQDCLRRAISLQGEDCSATSEFHTTLLFILSCTIADPDTLFAEHCRFGARFEAPLRKSWPQHSNSRDPGRCLQIGVISGDLFQHSVASFFEPVLAALHGAPGVKLYAYYNNVVEDEVNKRMRGHFDGWRVVSGWSDGQLEKKIKDDRIDIVLDLSGHTSRNRLTMLARKPAPIQVSWLGYPGTTGLQAMDYYLADRHWLPPGRFDRLFTEKLAYLPERWAFQPHADAPAVGALPALVSGRLTFGSFHQVGKINVSTIHLWSQLLVALPQSSLLLVGISPGAQQNGLVEQFAAQGIPLERLTFHDRCAMGRYFELHHLVDIGLDSHPYAGATTTMYSLSMGVPTLTMAGATAASRAGAGILAQVGLDGFIATNAGDFVEKGVYWANHLSELAEVRAGLRTRLEQSPGGQPEIIAAHLEGAFRHMWRRWCAGLPAESFHSIDIAL